MKAKKKTTSKSSKKKITRKKAVKNTAALAKKNAIRKKTVKKTAAPGKKKAVRKTFSPRKRKTAVRPVPLDKLCWHCEPEMLPFASTVDVEPLSDVAVQRVAIDTMKFGLETRTSGHNIYIRGISGTNRMAMIRLICRELRQDSPLAHDRCYVNNFTRPDRPRLITLPPGKGHDFKIAMQRLAEFIHTALLPILSSELMDVTQESLNRRAAGEIENLVKPFETALEEAGLALVTYQAGSAAQVAIFPRAGDKPVPPEEFERLHEAGEVTDEQMEAYRKNTAPFEKELEGINEKVAVIQREHEESVRELMERTTRWVLKNQIHEIQSEYPIESVRLFLDEIVEDLVGQRLSHIREGKDFTRLYAVNCVLEHNEGDGPPIITETLATVRSLLGTIDYEFNAAGEARAGHTGIRAGSLLRADGGILILDVRDLYRESAVWRTLVRTLRTGKLEIIPPDSAMDRAGPSIQPEPIPINVKVVLIGDAKTYAIFDSNDPDFSQLFKVLVHYNKVIPRDAKGIRIYAQLIARISRLERLPPFDSAAVMALAEQGARLAGLGGKLTTDFDRLSDVACEAGYLTVKGGKPMVTNEEVKHASQRIRDRADLPARQFRELLSSGMIQVVTEGTEVGQINGLAVSQTGNMHYGFPARVTATIGPGTAGVINIEGEAALSGAIHTKGFYILGGLLRHLLRTDHPLAFDASIAFEQSYGGIDGDSASGAEICCLLSALTDIPLRQDMAMTGAIDQKGNIQAVGAVNEKIEGFFEVCSDNGLTGTQGIVIPASNVDDLMLRDDVVKACEAGLFRIYGVKTVQEALEIMTGIPAGVRGKNGAYPRKSLLGIATDRAYDYWIKATAHKGPKRKR